MTFPLAVPNRGLHVELLHENMSPLGKNIELAGKIKLQSLSSLGAFGDQLRY